MTKFDPIKQTLTQNKKIFLPAAIVAILAGLVLVWFGLMRTVTVIVDGAAVEVRTPALTISGVLRAAGLPNDRSSRSQPARGRLIWNAPVITVQSAREVVLATPEYEISFRSAESVPANLLQLAEIPLYPNDQVRVNGMKVDALEMVDAVDGFVLQYLPAQPITLEMGDLTRTIYSAQPTLGAALEEARIEISLQDAITPDLETPIDGPLDVTLRRARVVTVEVGGETVQGMTAATTVGEALLSMDIPLENLDYSVPAESDALPDDGEIKLVRVREDLLVTTDETPFEVQYQEDPDTELDASSVIQEGQNAIYATRERIGYEDGEEAWRVSNATWQASEQRTGIYGYGTKIVNHTAVVDGITIEYYRKISVYFHTYKPCIPGTNTCYYGTSSGLPVDKGIIAVSLDWYHMLKMNRVYIPGYGYGVIADVCPECAGQLLIDLGYPEDGYDPIPNAWTTMYFISPAPAYVPVPFP